ncbi:hypothetical protein PROFUN_01657 [Planoprotostelium fungivorum]|uniref:Dolichyldiphosphatase n=1 Tax=Planoprotostelium fungivorum TaxID=1890364 RepID=A0A2P6MW51_9EUKA|nr:hypothetical protein PROFUN_01657 [Planoprotostelium fungivorum]
MGHKAFSLTLVFYEEGDPLSLILAIFTLAPLFIVGGFVAALIVRRELQMLYFFIGQLLNEVFNMVLKKVIREPRPPGAGKLGKTSYGMPSDHAQFMFFFAMFVTLLTLTKRISFPNKFVRAGVISSVYLLSVIVAYSRIYLGLHTWPQIIAGGIIGSITGAVYFYLLHVLASSFIRQHISKRILDHPLSRVFYIIDVSMIKGDLMEEEYNLWLRLADRKKK